MGVTFYILLGKNLVDHRFEGGGFFEFQHLAGFEGLVQGLPNYGI